MFSRSSRTSCARRWLTRGAVAATAVGITAAAMAPSAAARPGTNIWLGDHYLCGVNYDVQVGPVKGGYTDGDCRARTGELFPGIGTSPDLYALGQIFLPGGASYSAWVEKVW